MFITVSVLYRPVEQLLSRTIAERDAHGTTGNEHLRVAATIQLVLGVVFVVAALALKGPIQDDLFNGSSTLYRVLIVAVLAYAVSYFARGFLAGRRRFGLYGALVLMEACSRVLFAVAVAVGIAEGQSVVALGMAAAPIVSLAVVPLALSRTRAPAPAMSDEEAGAEARHLDEVAAIEPGGEPEFSLANGTGFAVAVLVIMLAEQTFLNAGPLLVKATEGGAEGAALAGFTFNVLLIARAPLQLFQAVQTSILPHLTRLGARGETDPFKRSVNVTLTAIAGFAAVVAVGMAVAGPFAMDLVFGGEFAYDRLGPGADLGGHGPVPGGGHAQPGAAGAQPGAPGVRLLGGRGGGLRGLPAGARRSTTGCSRWRSGTYLARSRCADCSTRCTAPE